MPSVNRQLNVKDFDLGLANSLGIVAFLVVDRDRKNLVDLVTGLSFTLSSGMSIVGTPEGPALHVNGAAEFNFDHPAVDGTFGHIAYTLISRARPTAAATNSGGCIFGIAAKSVANGVIGNGWDTSATPKFGTFAWSSGGAGPQNVKTGALNQFDTVITQMNASAGKTWGDGISQGTAASGGTLQNPNTICIGAAYHPSAALNFATGDLLWAAIIRNTSATGVTLSDAAAWQLYATDFPYNLFRQSRRPWALSAGSPTFSIAGVGVAKPLAASLIAPAGIGAFSSLAASRIGVAGVGALGALAASLLSVSGVGAFAPLIPGTASFAISGSGAGVFKSAAKFSPSGLGAFNPQSAGSITFAFTGRGTTSFLGPGWRQPAAHSNIWTLRPPVSTSWATPSHPSNPWTRIL